MRLAMALSGRVHNDDEHRPGRVYKIVAPELDRAEVGAFVRARRLDPCDVCFRGMRAQIEAEKVAAR